MFLYLGYILVEILSLLYSTSLLNDVTFISEADQQVVSDIMPLLFIFLLIEAAVLLVPYAIGRHYSRQKARPWWAFLLLGAGIAALELTFFRLWGENLWLDTAHAVMPFVLFFAVAWLPLGRPEDKRARGGYQCPHCNARLSAKEFKRSGIFRSTGTCGYCHAELKRHIHIKYFLLWLVPIAVMLMFLTLNIPEAIRAHLFPGPFIGAMAGLLAALSQRLLPVEEKQQDAPSNASD